MITKRDFILCGSDFCEKYSLDHHQPSSFLPGGDLKFDPHNAATPRFGVTVMIPNLKSEEKFESSLLLGGKFEG